MPCPSGELPGAFTCRLDEQPGVVRVVATGELDVATAPIVDRALRDAHAHGGLVVLDLRGVPFCDSTGLHAVIGAEQLARRSGRRLVIVQGPRQVQRLFALTNLDEQLEIVQDPSAIAVGKPELTIAADRPHRAGQPEAETPGERNAL